MQIIGTRIWSSWTVVSKIKNLTKKNKQKNRENKNKIIFRTELQTK